jgi:hypothetical protein
MNGASVVLETAILTASVCRRLCRLAETVTGVCASATCYSGSEYVGVIAIVMPELKFRNVERQIFAADLVERADNAALNQRPQGGGECTERAALVCIDSAADAAAAVAGLDNANRACPTPAASKRNAGGDMGANYLRKLLARIKAILLTPQTEWKVIEAEHDTLFDLLISYVAILAAIPELAHFIGQSFIGGYTPIVPNLVRALVVYFVAFAMVYIIAGVIDLLAPRFGAEKNFANAVKLSAYSHTPLWLAGIFLLVPGLSFLLILGLYGFYLLWIGLPMLMKVSDDKALPYAAAVTACALIPAVVLTFV